MNQADKMILQVVRDAYLRGFTDGYNMNNLGEEAIEEDFRDMVDEAVSKVEKENRFLKRWAIKNGCTCEDKTTDYCPIHDGDYGDWKYGKNREEWDEMIEED
jgi:hypothetical protein